MTYPKAKLEAGVDAAGWYTARSVQRCLVYVAYWDGHRLYSAVTVEGKPTLPLTTLWTDFRPLSPVAQPPEVVVGPAELPEGRWYVQDAAGDYYPVSGPYRIDADERALRIPDTWLAALAKPEPVVTERHREAAKEIWESLLPSPSAMNLNVEWNRPELEKFLAKHFPAEQSK